VTEGDELLSCYWVLLLSHFLFILSAGFGVVLHVGLLYFFVYCFVETFVQLVVMCCLYLFYHCIVVAVSFFIRV
jgi:hypothetical protein